MRTAMQPRMPMNVRKDNGYTMTRLLVGAATLAVAYAVMQNIPDIVRYLRMRSM